MYKQKQLLDRAIFIQAFRRFVENITAKDAFLVDAHGHKSEGTVPYYIFDERRWYFQGDGVTCSQAVYTINDYDHIHPNLFVEVVAGFGKLEKDQENEEMNAKPEASKPNAVKKPYAEKLAERQDSQLQTISPPYLAMFNICSGKRWHHEGPRASYAKAKYTPNQIILSIAYIFRRDQNNNMVMCRQVRVYGTVWTKDTLEIPDEYLAPLFCGYLTRFESEVLQRVASRSD